MLGASPIKAIWARGHRRKLLIVELLLLTLASISADTGQIDLFINNPDLDSTPGRAAQNIVYYGVYFIGTPAKRFLGCFDTGSGDVWLPASTCTTDICASHDSYNPKDSSTLGIPSQADQATVSITYGTGQIIASKLYDTMSFGGIQIPQQYFGAASKLSEDFRTLSCDGLVGLAFPAMSHFAYNPPVFTASTDNLLDTNIFGIFMDPRPNVEPAGSLSIGKIEPSKFTGPMTTIPVTVQKYWTVSLGPVTLGTTAFALSVPDAILDSGTTAIFLPQNDATNINKAIPTSNYWAAQDVYTVSCDYSQLPDLTFTLGGKLFSLPPSLYVQELTTTAGKPLGMCASVILGGKARVILGSNFLRGWYTQYNFSPSGGPASVGLARAVGVVQGGTVTSAAGRKLKQEPYQNVLHKRMYDSFDQPRWGWYAPARREHNAINSTGSRAS